MWPAHDPCVVFGEYDTASNSNFSAWRQTPSASFFAAFVDFVARAYGALHPGVLLADASEERAGSEGDRGAWSVPIDFMTQRPFVQQACDSVFSCVPPLLCNDGSLRGGGDLRLRVLSYIHELQRIMWRQYLEWRESASIPSEPSTTPGAPPVEGAYLSLHREVHESYRPEGLRGTRNCSEAAAALRAGGDRLKARMPVLGAALHVALLHSSVPPNRPLVGGCALFHAGIGAQHSEIVARLLNLIGEDWATRDALSLVPPPPRSAQRAVEVGVRSGYTSAYLLDHVPRLSLLSVDPYAEVDPLYAKGDPLRQFQNVRRMLSRYGDRSRLLRQTSERAAARVNGTFDLVFIDADHGYESVQTDIRCWFPRVREGGLLSGHDYSARFPGVVQAVNEFTLTVGATLHLGPAFTWWVFSGRKAQERTPCRDTTLSLFGRQAQEL